jgi:SH3-like domain-containing protein
MPGRNKHLMLLATCMALAALVAGCKRQSAAEIPSIGTAFAGPVTLNLRAEISPEAKTIATTRHGEKLDILQVRRRFVRVRTPSGQIGWTDSRNLLTSRQMEELAELAKRSAKLPSQGEATVYGMLNMHITPARASTSFYQIVEGVHVEVLSHRVSPRAQAGTTPAPVLDLNKPAPRRPRKKKEPDYPPPPRPSAPGLPRNWAELSKTHLPEPPPPPPEDPAEKLKKKKKRRVKAAGPPMEDWTLVRTKDGKAGWVLSRMLVMAIPDEVAQYAEGARITSYFLLGTVMDEGVTKHHWLWTTVREDDAPHDFDSFRVFTYVVRKHRYETAYIERSIEGYYPTEAKPGTIPRFSLILRNPDDGKLYRKTWIMEGYLTRKVAEEPYVPAKGEDDAEKPADSLTDKLRSLLDE